MTDDQTATLPRVEAEPEAPTVRKFASQYPELRLVMQPADDIPVDNRGHTRRVPGAYINFRDGLYQTSDPAEIEFLENHVNRDRLFREVTELVPKPDSAPILRRIVELTGRRDIDALNEILTQERLGEQREDVLDACETAVEILDQTGPDEPSEPLPAATGALSAAAGAPLPEDEGLAGLSGPAGHAPERPRESSEE